MCTEKREWRESEVDTGEDCGWTSLFLMWAFKFDGEHRKKIRRSIRLNLLLP